MKLRIQTPQTNLFTGSVNSVRLPGVLGSLQILRSHAPLISILHSGNVVYTTREGKHTIPIQKGIVSVLNNEIILFAQ